MPRMDDIVVERGSTQPITKQFGFQDNPAPRVLTGYTGTLEVFSDGLMTVPLFPAKTGVVSTDTFSMQWVPTTAETNFRPGYYSCKITLSKAGAVEIYHGWFIIEGA